MEKAPNEIFTESDCFWTLRQPLREWFDDNNVHHKQWPGGLTQDLGKFFPREKWVNCSQDEGSPQALCCVRPWTMDS